MKTSFSAIAASVVFISALFPLTVASAEVPQDGERRVMIDVPEMVDSVVAYSGNRDAETLVLLTDVPGRVYFSREGISDFVEIDRGNLPAGDYVLWMKSGCQTETVKIVNK